jgi:hypothetical protein
MKETLDYLLPPGCVTLMMLAVAPPFSQSIRAFIFPAAGISFNKTEGWKALPETSVGENVIRLKPITGWWGQPA